VHYRYKFPNKEAFAGAKAMVIMKIKVKKLDYDKVMELPKVRHRRPMKPSRVLHTLVRVLSIPELFGVGFSFTSERMEEAGNGPYLVLMNHSSFIDLKIAFRLLYPKRFSIVCTSDGFVGKSLLMRFLGCIPTNKFVNDIKLIKDMKHALHKNNTSVLMFPEASYSFDGRATPLPQKLGKLLKMLDVPVVGIRTFGAFSYDPLYNGLRKRKVRISADMRCLLTREEIAAMSVEEIDGVLGEMFSFDNFKWQKENGVEIKEDFRAEGLERILFRCIECGKEGGMKGSGTTLTCGCCGRKFELSELGELVGEDGGKYHIPDWYEWERREIRREIEAGEYRLCADVDIGMLVDHKAIYMVGSGRLVHDGDGFLLTGCDGRLEYRQSPLNCYSLYSDYYWYEIGDMICIGGNDCLYYCFPKGNESVAKARIAAEEMYKLRKKRNNG